MKPKPPKKKDPKPKVKSGKTPKEQVRYKFLDNGDIFDSEKNIIYQVEFSELPTYKVTNGIITGIITDIKLCAFDGKQLREYTLDLSKIK
jgi:hypothetical protein